MKLRVVKPQSRLLRQFCVPFPENVDESLGENWSSCTCLCIGDAGLRRSFEFVFGQCSVITA